MSFQLSPEQIAGLRHNVELLVEQTAAHQKDVDNLVAAAQRDVQEAQAIALITQLLGRTTPPDVNVASVQEVRHLLSGYVERIASGASRARQLLAGAREQHGAACRVLAALTDDEPIAESSRDAVLVADDHDGVRGLVATVLQSAGFVVRTAANGLEALIAAYEMRPRIIVMDVAMPVLDGIEATRLIKATDATRGARVIAHTGNSSLDSTVVDRLFSAVVYKPAAPALLLSTVQHVAAL